MFKWTRSITHTFSVKRKAMQMHRWLSTTSSLPATAAYTTHGDGEVDMDSKEFIQDLEKYSNYQPCPLSIAHFLEFGRNANLQASFLFMRREVPVRIANIMKELHLMPKELINTKGCSLVTRQYAQSFKDVLAYESLSAKDPAVLNDFTNSLINIRERHSDTVISMAEAVMELKTIQAQEDKEAGRKSKHRNRPKFEKNIQYFLDRLYTSRISTRMLINQHTMLFDDPSNRTSHLVGTIDPQCEITPVVVQAYESARFLCEQYYLSAPAMEYTSYDGSTRGAPANKDENGNDKIQFVYVPSHLYHVLFELFKNSMRATIEHAGEDEIDFPPVKVLVCKGKEDVTIRISDRGGGIPRSLRDHIFEYLYTTAPNPIMTNSAEIQDVSSMMGGGGMSGMSSAPLAGLGYGLPLSRLYTRYFAGDLQLYSAEGWGTDAVIYLHALAGEAKERLPVYHETGTKKIYDAQLTANDWTMSSSQEGLMELSKQKSHDKKQP